MSAVSKPAGVHLWRFVTAACTSWQCSCVLWLYRICSEKKWFWEMVLWWEALKRIALIWNKFMQQLTKDVLICLPPWPFHPILLKSLTMLLKQPGLVRREHSFCHGTQKESDAVLEANFSKWIRVLQQAWKQEGSRAHCEQSDGLCRGFTGPFTIWKSLVQAHLCCHPIQMQPLSLDSFYSYCALKLWKVSQFCHR